MDPRFSLPTVGPQQTFGCQPCCPGDDFYVDISAAADNVFDNSRLHPKYTATSFHAFPTHVSLGGVDYDLGDEASADAYEMAVMASPLESRRRSEEGLCFRYPWSAHTMDRMRLSSRSDYQ